MASIMYEIIRCRQEIQKSNLQIAIAKANLNGLKQSHGKLESRLVMLLDEYTGLNGPGLFDNVPPQTAVPPSPPPVPTPSPEELRDWVKEHNLTGWRATPVDELDIDDEIAASVKAVIRPELQFAGFVLDELIDGRKFGLDSDQLKVLHRAIYALRSWRDCGLDQLGVNPSVEGKILRSGIETLGQLADKLDTGETFHLGAKDLKTVKNLMSVLRADEPDESQTKETTGPLVCDSIGSFKIRDIEGFPAKVAKKLESSGCHTLFDLQQRAEEIAKNKPGVQPDLTKIAFTVLSSFDPNHTLTSSDIWPAVEAIHKHFNVPMSEDEDDGQSKNADNAKPEPKPKRTRKAKQTA